MATLENPLGIPIPIFQFFDASKLGREKKICWEKYQRIFPLAGSLTPPAWFRSPQKHLSFLYQLPGQQCPHPHGSFPVTPSLLYLSTPSYWNAWWQGIIWAPSVKANYFYLCLYLETILWAEGHSGHQRPTFFFFLAKLGLHCWTWASSSWGEGGLLFVTVHGLLVAVASFVAEHGLYVRRLQ